MNQRKLAWSCCVMLASACALVAGCSDQLKVLGAAQANSQRDGGRDDRPGDGEDAATPSVPDGGYGFDAGLAPDPDHEGPRVDPEPVDAHCPTCAATQLCALDRCVEVSGGRSLDSGRMHVCEVREGRLYCWGANDAGQLGTGDTQDRDRRVRVGSYNDWLQVAGGEHHSCALRAPGRLYCWGANDAGQLGTGDTTARKSPAAIAPRIAFRQVAAGGDSSCAIDAEGTLYCWGDNLEGKPGQDDPYGSPDVTRPQPVTGGPYAEVALGQGHVCAIDHAGALYCWGRNAQGETGIGTTDPIQTRAPRRVGDADDWIQIDASQHHSCGVRQDGGLWCWGHNSSLELSAPPDLELALEPRRVGERSDWVEVATGWFHTCAIDTASRLFCWGRAIEGQLGQGEFAEQPIMQPQPVQSEVSFTHMTAGNFHTCAFDDQRALYCWGMGDNGRLGQGDLARHSTPTPVP